MNASPSTLIQNPTAQNTLQNTSDEYTTKGYIILRGLFSAEEVAAWGLECDRLLAQDWCEPSNARTPYRKDSRQTPERIDPVVDVSPAFAQLVCDERILSALRGLFEDEALLFKDKVIFKMPGVDGYTMHQDWAWGWQDLCPADDILSVSIQIDGADASNGGIELFPGYQHELLTPPGLQTNMREQEIARIDLSRGEKMTTAPGDVLIFHALTPHQSGRNTSTRSRRSLYLTYNAARAGELREDYYEAYKERTGRENGAQGFR